MAESLIDLAPELVELILSFLGPSDLVTFGQTCRCATQFTLPSNQILWRSAFLQVFDNPKTAWELLLPSARPNNRSREAQWDWYREVRRRFEAFNAVHQRTADAAVPLDSESVVTTFLDIIDTASISQLESLNIDYLRRLFKAGPSAEKIVHDYHRDIDSISLPLDLIQADSRPFTRSMLGRREIPEWASRFHVLYGATSREADSVRARCCARAIIYDWSVTDSRAEYGPFTKDNTCTVNFATVEAIASLMHRVLEKGHKLRVPPGLFWHSIPYSMSSQFLPQEDWAGVTHPWVGTYAFLDYRSLVHYNFANNLEHPMDLGGFEEACGDLMRLELKINDSEDLRQDPRLQTELPSCTDLPMLFFRGTSNGRSQRPAILVRGSVSLTPNAKQVRWRFIISYAGEDQWSLEGVQPAGPRSGGIIYGLWSHVDHDDHGPTGPFCYFPSECCEQDYTQEE
ncbi:hypothetical protein K491DRAFT_605108 [Lophiostoma macrostomum CBS 122681]|uniref:F-box domain-containing protein n=1 Tax=Lophiostoma macrostomum CBS 122681 TaxID=1314788 RepID=A0A6A6SXD6_9PLEO|nr:hypothetical protein K491DRAFT_605108 [Lophiostoma macrostomum CBS 122681]